MTTISTPVRTTSQAGGPAAPVSTASGNPMVYGATVLAAMAGKIGDDMALVIANSRGTVTQMKNNTDALNGVQNRTLPAVSWPTYNQPAGSPAEQDARDAAAFAATQAAEGMGANLSTYWNRYRVATTSETGITTYAYFDHPQQPRIPDDDPYRKETAFVVNPTPDQLINIMGSIASPPLEALAQNLLFAGVNVTNVSDYDAAKYAWGPDNTVSYSALPAALVDDPAATARSGKMNDALVQKKGTGEYYRIDGQNAYLVRSPLPLDQATLVDPGTTDFSMLAPGTIAKMQTGQDDQGQPVYTYYQVVANNDLNLTDVKGTTAVEVTAPLKFMLRPSDAQLTDWRDQLARFNTALGALSNSQQAFLQEKLALFNNLWTMVSNMFSEDARVKNSIRF